MKPKVIFLLGATGSGKSKMAVYLAQKFDGEIISADSVQIYRGFDIGSAKVTQNEMQGIKHHCIDICEADDYFTVSDFVELTKQKIIEITSHGKLPIVVGGTGLYINSLVNGYNFGGTSKQDEFRKNIEQQINEKGEEKLWEELFTLAPQIANKIDKHNKPRIIRGLEIAKFGKAQTQVRTDDFDFKIYALKLDRQVLYSRINKRVEEMLTQGLVQEVQTLLARGVKEDCQPMRAIGYKEVISLLKGEIDDEKMQELIKQHSRNYAKRQMTYLRGLEKSVAIKYIDVFDFEKGKNELIKDLERWL